MFDYWQREDIDRLFFEIWKFATKKMGATDKKVSIVNICHGIAICYVLMEPNLGHIQE